MSLPPALTNSSTGKPTVRGEGAEHASEPGAAVASPDRPVWVWSFDAKARIAADELFRQHKGRCPAVDARRPVVQVEPRRVMPVSSRLASPLLLRRGR